MRIALMLDSENTGEGTPATTGSTSTPDTGSTAGVGTGTPRRRRAAARPAGPPAVSPPAPAPSPEPSPAAGPQAGSDDDGPVKAAPPRRHTRKTAEAHPDAAAPGGGELTAAAGTGPTASPDDLADAAAAKAPARRRRKSAAVEPGTAPAEPDGSEQAGPPQPQVAPPVLFQAPAEPAKAGPAPRRTRKVAATATAAGEDDLEDTDAAADRDDIDDIDDGEHGDHDEEGADGPRRRRRRRGGRGRRRPSGSDGASTDDGQDAEPSPADDDAQPAGRAGRGPDETAESEDDGEGGTVGTRRRRRRRRKGSDDAPEGADDVVVHVREPRARGSRASSSASEVTAVRGSTRLEAKKQRRREGRDAGRRRPPILSEAEFLARRESVRRVMVVRQRADLTQIAVLEDDVLVEHYVASASSSTMVGNVYLGKVQNVLPSMEAAFVDIGRGRNAVLYAGEVNWDAAALDGQPKRIEHVLKSGDSVLVQVTKDPMGHKGSRLTSNVSLAGRFLVYVPDGSMSGISRKLPDKERSRLKAILKGIVPDDAGVIVRTAAEGTTEEQLTHDVERLKEQWADIERTSKSAAAPSLLYSEPDLTVRVIRDLFNEDFERLVVSGEGAWETVQGYVEQVAPDLMDRVERHAGKDDVFTAFRVDEQLAKGLDRKVWLPSGGSLVIDRTEAMTVVDVNTGKFVGKGSGNLEETVTKNNLEAAEEIVRQLRLRDIGGIIVIDFIDMVLESNRELVLRRLTESLGRDRTKHQVAEVTSLGLVQMTRKRIGQGLLEAFSEPCEHCNGRGLKIHLEPVEGRAAKGARSPENVDRLERVARAVRTGKSGAGSQPAAEPDASMPDGEPAAAPTRARRSRSKSAAAAPAAEAVEAAGDDAPSGLSTQTVHGQQDGGSAAAAARPRRRRASKPQGAPAPVG